MNWASFFVWTSSILLGFVSVILICIILLQRGRGGGLAGAFGGVGSQSALGIKAGDVFTKITIGLTVVWVILSGLTAFAMRAESSRYTGDGTTPPKNEKIESTLATDKTTMESEADLPAKTAPVAPAKTAAPFPQPKTPATEKTEATKTVDGKTPAVSAPAKTPAGPAAKTATESKTAVPAKTSASPAAKTPTTPAPAAKTP